MKRKPRRKPEEPEIWAGIPGLDFYEASSFGRIRSLDRVLPLIGRWGPMSRFHKGRILKLKPKPNGSGAIYFCFYADGGKYFQVNRVVCAAFGGPAPSPDHEAAHLDGDTSNNRSDNLCWATPLENAAHKIAHGTNPIGSKNGMAALTEVNVGPVFEAYCDGASLDKIASGFAVSPGTISNIVSGKSWRHVDVGDFRLAAKRRARENLEKSWAEAADRRRRLGPTLKKKISA